MQLLVLKVLLKYFPFLTCFIKYGVFISMLSFSVFFKCVYKKNVNFINKIIFFFICFLNKQNKTYITIVYKKKYKKSLLYYNLLLFSSFKCNGIRNHFIKKKIMLGWGWTFSVHVIFYYVFIFFKHFSKSVFILKIYLLCLIIISLLMIIKDSYRIS